MTSIAEGGLQIIKCIHPAPLGAQGGAKNMSRDTYPDLSSATLIVTKFDIMASIGEGEYKLLNSFTPPPWGPREGQKTQKSSVPGHLSQLIISNTDHDQI